MKKIKAFIRKRKSEEVVEGLEAIGIIYISGVEQAIRIRTGRTGRDVLLLGD